MYYTKSYKLHHPNPQFARKDFEILDGIWDFIFDEDNKEIEEKYFKVFPKNSLKIEVPYTYQADKGLSIPTKDNDIVWYHKKVVITKLYQKMDLVVLGCDYEFTLYVNGHNAGFHKGGYDISRFGIEKYLTLGDNSIVFQVKDYKKEDIIRGKQTTDKVEGCFYECVTGIYKSLYLEFYNSSHISSYRAKASYLNNNLSLDIDLVECENKRLKVELIFENKCLLSQEFDITNNKFNKVLDVMNVNAWSQENPNLYDLVLTIIDEEDDVLDRIYTYVGFRDFASRNGHIYLNNEDIYLKGILYQGYYDKGFYTGDEESFKKDFSLLKKAGFNFIRIHQKVETPLFMFLSDFYGMYCTLEIPSSKSFSQEYEENYLQEVDRIVKDNINHPSIFSLILFNESWGINKVNDDKYIQEFTIKCYNHYKELYPELFISSNDGWEHTISDLCTIHNYEANGNVLKNFEEEQYQILLKEGNALSNQANYKIYAGDYKYHNQPLILSEFGGYGLNSDDIKNAWCYGEASKNVDDYISRLELMYSSIASLPFIRGVCYTQYNDVFPELNGIVSSNRKEKINVKLLKKFNDMLGKNYD